MRCHNNNNTANNSGCSLYYLYLFIIDDEHMIAQYKYSWQELEKTRNFCENNSSLIPSSSYQVWPVFFFFSFLFIFSPLLTIFITLQARRFTSRGAYTVCHTWLRYIPSHRTQVPKYSRGFLFSTILSLKIYHRQNVSSGQQGFRSVHDDTIVSTFIKVPSQRCHVERSTIT